MRSMLVFLALLVAGCVSATETSGAPPVAEIQRSYASASAPFAKSVIIPPGYETIRLPGIVADPLTPARDNQPANYGDTETQTASALAKIAVSLTEHGLTEADVVAMTVYLVAPAPGQPMDFSGMMRAYSKRYGLETQPNRPVRSTVQVAGLVAPGMLVEIEVTAAARPR
jgi:enamine deaminase RidA (YjgF/YER057c/UK114 family)